MGVLDTLRRRKSADEALDTEVKPGSTYDDYPVLVAIKPNERYVFRSDYFQVDDYFACVLSFFHSDASQDSFAPFWGIYQIPMGLDNEVTTVLLEQVRRRGEKWVESRLKRSDQLDKLEQREQNEAGSASSRRRQAKVADDMTIIVGEIQDGSSYLHVQDRMFVKAPSLEMLDEAVDKIGRLFIERFGTVQVAPYIGEQRQELSNLWITNDKKKGKGFHFTSAELAGKYGLVTNGLSDPAGEYVGYMVGDVNNSAVLMDVDQYERHVVVADDAQYPSLNRAYVSDMWASKISQAALINNHRVVHLVLEAANLDELGPTLNNITSRVDMNNGDVNMFEMFGAKEDELSIFPAHIQKLQLMTEQAYEPTDTDRSIIRGKLSEILTQFYVAQRMWYLNAPRNRDRLRLVDLPHDQVPLLQTFILHIEERRKALIDSSKNDPAELHAFTVLETVFRSMLDNNTDLFNTVTRSSIDHVRENRRVIYDFSRLLRRGKGVAMAQLVNIVGFAVDSLQRGDVVIVHGTEDIDGGVKEYITQQFEHLTRRGGRVVYCYNDVDKMLEDRSFNRLEDADYSLLGAMTENVAVRYQTAIGQQIPQDLQSLITTRKSNLTYLRRGVNNVVFNLDLALGKNTSRTSRRHLTAASVAERDLQADSVGEAVGRVQEKRQRDVEANGAQARLARREKAAAADRRTQRLSPRPARTLGKTKN